MFLKPKVLKKLMKEAYKGGLVVARREDDWIYIAGDCWEMEVKKDYIPKETMGDLIALVGELPDKEQRYRAYDSGNQIEIGMPMRVLYEPYTESDALYVTDVLMIGNGGTICRLLQSISGEVYAVNNVFVDIICNMQIEDLRGETSVEHPYKMMMGIIWENNVCKLRAMFRTDNRNKLQIRNLQNVDLLTRYDPTMEEGEQDE